MENESRPGSPAPATRGTTRSGLLLIIVGAAVVGFDPAVPLIALAGVALVLDRLAPRILDSTIDLLKF